MEIFFHCLNLQAKYHKCEMETAKNGALLALKGART